ncbi:MAG TPA: hypothetical protein VFJ58_29755 [Armatimonadota bacterium]|nr:hypothetical protein [Armatimonadota bacterium]
MKLKRTIAIGAALLTVFGGITAAIASRDSDARDQIHHIYVDARSLVPVFAGQLNPGYSSRNGYAFDSTRGSDQLRAMMAVGAFEGEAQALSETMDRYHNASVGPALQDLDRAFRSADQWVQYAGVNSDVDHRWSNIRNDYFEFQHTVDGGPGYNRSSVPYDYNRPRGQRPHIDIHLGR